MNKLVSLGELIIDFTSVGNSGLKGTKEFVKNAGGAPANLCAQVAKLGAKTLYLSAVGDDGFGDFLIESLKDVNVDTSYIKKTKEFDSSLAFVSLKEDGNREFKFYRKNAADLNFSISNFTSIKFNKKDIFEFGSVALATAKSREVHSYLINKAKKNNCLVCFDPNLRLNLWDDHNKLKAIVNEYLKVTDIAKISDDELEFITGFKEEKEAVSYILSLGVKVLLISKGPNGATLYTIDGKVIHNNGYKVNAIDTTGSGDSFFGGFIYNLLFAKLDKLNLLEFEEFEKSLDIACRCGSYTAQSLGAIAAMGNLEEIYMLK